MRLWWTDPNRVGLWILICILAVLTLALVLISDYARAETPADHDDDSGASWGLSAARVDRAVLHLVGEYANPMQSVARRAEFVSAVVTASEAHDVPPLLLTAMAYLEGSFRRTVVGKLGEQSTWQLHGQAASGCDLSTYAGAADCAAGWLNHCRDICGGELAGAISLYASGRTCQPTDRLRGVVRLRLKLWAKLERLTDDHHER